MFLNTVSPPFFPPMFRTGWMCVSPWWSFTHALVALQAFCQDKSRHEKPPDLCSGSAKVMKEAAHCARGNAVIIFHLKIVPRLCPMGRCITHTYTHVHVSDIVYDPQNLMTLELPWFCMAFKHDYKHYSAFI